MSPFRSIVPPVGHARPDWQAIEDQFTWFCKLKGCPQDPVFHAEGDVHVHTRMVVEALLADPNWQRLGEAERESLFWAALLHDVAKPNCTRMEPDGRIIAPGHSRRGQIIARHILQDMSVPFEQREMICHLITHHQVPFFLIDQEKPERRAHLISYQARCDLLAILAAADANGRLCSDRQRLLDNISLFRELCHEQRCLVAPREFPSDHSRFLYFRLEDRSAEYEAFDDWDMETIVMSGLPASGKDHWLTANEGAREIISLDELRKSLGVEPTDSQTAVIARAKERARELLRVRRPFIWNATNVSRQIRAQLIDLLAAYKSKVHIVYVETCRSEAERRNRHRCAPVSSKAMERMRNRWEPPDLTECHQLTRIFN